VADVRNTAAAPELAPAERDLKVVPPPAPGEPDDLPYVPLDLTSPQLTVRAVVTGMVLGAALALCNIYAGLKVGWGFNMSITAALLGFGFWSAARVAVKSRPFGILESNINQTTASSAASISSAGLVSAMPALTILTGQTLPWHLLALWTFVICLVGISVAVGLRRQMILVDKLPFPSGIAAAQTLKEMYAKGSEAMIRVRYLLGGAIVASTVKLVEVIATLPKFAVPGALKLKGAAGGTVPAQATLGNLTFAFEPTLMMVGVGAIIGIRAGVSLLAGSIIAYAVIAPAVIERGWARTGAADGFWFGPLTQWLLWPGVAMMVTCALTSFAFSWRSIAASMGIGRKKAAAGAPPEADLGDVSKPWFLRGLAVALVLATLCQVFLFDIGWGIAVFAVLITFALAVVAGRVTGETAITPVGPMGKVTQLMFGIIAPGSPAANLMSANVTGGAASQCGDLLHDLKAGYLLGAKARLQAIGQVLGALAGALAGSAAYLVLIPDPKNQLLTNEWPAPAAAAWKAVAELFMKGFEAMPGGALVAMGIAGGLGIVLAIVEKLVPKTMIKWVPSPAALGLAFVIPAWNSMSMFMGAVLALVAARFFKSWAAKFVVVIASGIIAGESLTGVGVALQKMLFP
jgi:putative OPT family oligopeptide transporter